MKYQIIYISETGNTEKLAKYIFQILPGRDKDIVRFEPGMTLGEADVYLIGFWIKRGTCNLDLLNYISELHGKKIALFGTCGMGDSESYFRKIREELEVWVPDDSTFLGTFLCQGKMPMQVREKYEALLLKERNEKIEPMIANFDRALTHPDKTDLKNLEDFVKKIQKTLDL